MVGFVLGKNISRLYRVNPATGLAGEQVAWIIDLLDKNIIYKGERHDLTLKRIVNTSDENFPKYLVIDEFCAAPGTIIVEEHKNISEKGFVLLPTIVGDKENLSKYFHYFHAVIDDSDQPLMQEKLQKFDEALRISPINCYGESQPTIEY